MKVGYIRVSTAEQNTIRQEVLMRELEVEQIYIDKASGVGLNDCENASRAAELVLDTADPIQGAYVLEVSSPGIERKLVKDAHYAKHIGETVEVKLNKSNIQKGGQKKFTGRLAGITEAAKGTDNGVRYIVLMQPDGSEVRINRGDVAVCRLVYDYK